MSNAACHKRDICLNNVCHMSKAAYNKAGVILLVFGFSDVL